MDGLSVRAGKQRQGKLPEVWIRSSAAWIPGSLLCPDVELTRPLRIEFDGTEDFLAKSERYLRVATTTSASLGSLSGDPPGQNNQRPRTHRAHSSSDSVVSGSSSTMRTTRSFPVAAAHLKGPAEGLPPSSDYGIVRGFPARSGWRVCGSADRPDSISLTGSAIPGSAGRLHRGHGRVGGDATRGD